MTRNYETLDAIVVSWVCLILTGSLYFLLTKEVPDNNLPIVAGLLGTLLGTVIGGYAAFRWSSNQQAKAAAEVSAATAKTTTEALAQIAGAGPPPPAAPLDADAASPAESPPDAATRR